MVSLPGSAFANLNSADLRSTRRFSEFANGIVLWHHPTRAGVITAKVRGRAGDRLAKLTGERIEHARNFLAAGSSVSSVARSMGASRASVYRALERAGTGVE
jgi:hypothetical protein